MMSAAAPYMLVVNPASGTVSKHRIIPHLCRKLDAMGIEYDIAPTDGPGHATVLARQAVDEGREALLVCGGDGTVNEAASGLIGSHTAMGILPSGSGNGLARHLGIPVDIDSALKVIGGHNIIRADYGTANGNPFFCTFGVGFDAAVSERCARQRRRGIMMYLKNAFDEYIKFNPEEYIIEANGKVITEQAFLVVCCNASQYGNNAFVAPNASITDGELDITIVHKGNLVSRAMVGMDMLTGLIGKNALVETFRARSATIIRKTDSAAHVDGDVIRLDKSIEVKCHHAGIDVFSPTDRTRFVPLLTPTRLMLRDAFLGARKLLSFRAK